MQHRKILLIVAMAFLVILVAGKSWADYTEYQRFINPPYPHAYSFSEVKLGVSTDFHVQLGGSFSYPCDWWVDGTLVELRRTTQGNTEYGSTGRPFPWTFTTPGAHSLRVVCYEGERAAWGGTVNFSAVPATPVISIIGANSAIEGETKHYSVTHNATVSVSIAWTVDGVLCPGNEIDVPFPTVGSHNVSVKVTPTGLPSAAATSAKTVTVSTHPTPVISIIGANSAIEGETKHYSVTHNATVSVGIAWTVDGVSYPGNKIDVPFPTVGSHNVSVKVTPIAFPNSQGTSTRSVFVSKYPAPSVTLTGASTALEGETKHYSLVHDATEQVAIGWTVNGVAYPGNEIDVTFPTAGDITVSAVVYPLSHPGSTTTRSVVVRVSAYPSPAVTLTGPMSAIEGETKSYTVTYASADEVVIEWDVDGVAFTGTTVNVPFPESGFHPVKVKVYPVLYPASQTTKTITVKVSPYPSPSIKLTGATKVMEGSANRYSLSHNATEDVVIEWKIGTTVLDSTDLFQDITFPAAGLFTLTASVYPVGHPNSRTIESLVIVAASQPVPTLSVEGARTTTEGQIEQYTATVSSENPTTLEWDVNGTKYEGNPVNVTFAIAGSYEVTVTTFPTATPAATKIVKFTVIANPVKPPVISVVPVKKGLVGTPLKLSASAKNLTTGIPLVVGWELPDGTTVSESETIYIPRVEDIGTPSFRFFAYPQGYLGSIKDVEFTVPISQYALPNFTLETFHKPSGTVPHTVTYSANAYLIGFTEPLVYNWDMGDGTVGPDKNKKIYTYTKPGTYEVRLVISDTKSHTQVFTDTVSVLPLQEIAIDAINIKGTNAFMKAPVVGIFKPAVTGGNPKTDRYALFAWTVNGQPLAKKTSTMVYNFTQPGTYVIGLTVTSKSGLTGTGSVTVVINANKPPECKIDYVDVPSMKYTRLSPTCIDVDGKLRSFTWDLGNGQVFNSKSIAARYTESGTYTVTLTVGDNSGGQTVVSRDIAVVR